MTSLGSGETGHRWPSFLPDNDHFLYLAQADLADDLRVGSLTSADTVSFGAFESNARHVGGRLLFVRNGRLMSQLFDTDTRQLEDDPVVVADGVAVVVPWGRGQFSVSGTGVLGYSGTGRPLSQLTWMNRAGQSLSTVGEPDYYLNLDLNPDDTRIAVSRYTQPTGQPWNGDIWTIDAVRNTPKRLTTHPGREFDPAWSHDGTDIAFNSQRREGGSGLFRRSANGSGEDERLPSGSGTTPDWSPERVLIYTGEGEGTGSDLWTLSVSGDRKRKPFLNTPFSEGGGEFSRDGRWVAYQSNESGRFEVSVRPFPRSDGESHPISRAGGRYARWRADGRELFFVSLEGMLMAADIDTTKGFAATVPKQLFQTSLVPAANHPYAVSRDGQRFLVPVILNQPGATPITVVLNWPARLRQ